MHRNWAYSKFCAYATKHDESSRKRYSAVAKFLPRHGDYGRRISIRKAPFTRYNLLSTAVSCKRGLRFPTEAGYDDVKTMVIEVIRHKATSPPHTDGSVVFARLRQCALTSNTWFPGPTRLSISKLHLDRYSRFCTAHGRECLCLCRPFSPQYCPLSWGSWPHPIRRSLGPRETTP